MFSHSCWCLYHHSMLTQTLSQCLNERAQMSVFVHAIQIKHWHKPLWPASIKTIWSESTCLLSNWLNFCQVCNEWKVISSVCYLNSKGPINLEHCIVLYTPKASYNSSAKAAAHCACSWFLVLALLWAIQWANDQPQEYCGGYSVIPTEKRREGKQTRIRHINDTGDWRGGTLFL